MELIASTFGQVQNPLSTLGGSAALTTANTNGSGLFSIINALLRTAVVVAGLYTLINFIIAGYLFLSAGGDQKKFAQAWEKIYVSIIGLLVVAGSLLLAAIIGFIVFGDATMLITPRIFTPQ